MQTLVTGGTGFVGSHLCELLISKGHRVRCLVRQSSDLKWLQGLQVELVRGEFTDRESLKASVTDCEVIYHLAGLTKARQAEDYFKVNAEMCRHLFEACLLYNPGVKKIVHLSSLAAAGPSSPERQRVESDTPRPLTLYGKSKRKGEDYALEYSSCLPITVISPPAVYGPRETDIYMYFRLVNRHIRPLIGFREKFLSLIFVKDLVAGIVAAGESEHGVGQIYFLEDGHIYTIRELGRQIQRVLNKWAFPIHVPMVGIRCVGYMSEFIASVTRSTALLNRQKIIEIQQRAWTCDSAKFRDQFSFRPEYDLQRGLEETVKWYNQTNWL